MPVTRGEQGQARGGYKPKTKPKPKPSPVPRSKPVTAPRTSTTRAPARVTPAPAPTSPGDPAVAAIQRKLRAHGLKVTVDGIPGPETDAAIAAYNARLARKRVNVIKTQVTEPEPTVRTPPPLRPLPAGVIKTQFAEPTAPTTVATLPVPARHSGSALARYEPFDPNALGNIPGLQPHRVYAATPDLRTSQDKLIGELTGTFLSDPLGVLELGKSAVHLAKHPSFGAAAGTALAGVGLVPFLRGPRAAARVVSALREGRAFDEAVRAGAASFGERGPIATARESAALKQMKRDAMPVLENDPTRRVIFDQIDQAGLPEAHAVRLKNDLDEAAVRHADAAAKRFKGPGSLADRRAAHASSYYEHINPVDPLPRANAHIPQVVYPEKTQAARLRSKVKPRKGAATGVPTTPDLLARTADGTEFKIAGNITPEDWVQRVQAVIPSAAARDNLARWYEHYEPMFRKAFKKDADAVMRGFAVSQANASPSSGLAAVLKVMDKLRRGEQIGPREISVVAQSIGKAVEDKEIDKFVAAKLSDFVDSLAGKNTRTWMGDVTEAGSPTAVDIHAIRDRGFIDKKLRARIEALGAKHGKDFKIEGRGTATGPLYERISEWYQEIADHLNAMDGGKGFDGRSNWTPAQAQALGWSTIQMAHGVVPEGFAEAFANNTRAITFELTHGPLGLGNDLTQAQTRQVAQTMRDAAVRLADDTEGIWLRDVSIGVGGWEQGTNINLTLRVLGSEESVQAALTRYAQAFDQEWVQATREVSGKKARATLLIDSPKFRDPRTRARFFKALNRIEPRLEGFMDYDVDGVPALAIRTGSPSVSPKTADKFINRYRAAIEQAEAETGIEVSGSVRNMEMLTGGQHGEVAPVQTLAGSGGGLARGALDDPLAAQIRGELEAAIERARGPAEPGAAGPVEPEQKPPGILRRLMVEEKGAFTPGAEPGKPRPPDETLATPFEPVSDLTPEEQVQQGVRGARSQYGKQKVLRSEERRQRAEELDKALRSVADPDEARAAAADAMRGELPKIDFQGLSTLNADSLKYLKTYVKNSDLLLPYQKINLMDALDKAVRGRVPTPYEMRLIDHVFGKNTAMGIAQTAGNGWDVAINILNIPRSLQSTLDLSAVARQGLVALSSHPYLAGRAIPKMLRAARSPKYYDELMRGIEEDPVYNLALAGHVSFTDPSEYGSLAAQEEAFGSDYAARIPGFGHLIKGSSRAYTGFLNKVRMDLFKNQIRIAQTAGRNIQDEEFLKEIGKVVNAATGRGTLPERIEDWAPAVNAVFFSPRLMMSRIHYLDPTWYVRLGRGLPPGARRQVRIEALRGLFATVGAVSAGLYLFSRIPGVEVGSFDKDHPFGDPRSANWGKLKIGNTRIDLAGGFQQYVRLVAVLVTQTKVSSTSGKKTKLGTGKFGSQDTADVLIDFLRGKAAPSIGLGLNVASGRNMIGESVARGPLPEAAWSIARTSFIPLILQDTADLYKDRHGGVNGILWALGGYGLGAFGLGLQTYGPKVETGGGGGGGGDESYPGSGSGGESYPGSGGGGESYPGSGGSGESYPGAP